jgi:hypothetical protein
VVLDPAPGAVFQAAFAAPDDGTVVTTEPAAETATGGGARLPGGDQSGAGGSPAWAPAPQSPAGDLAAPAFDAPLQPAIAPVTPPPSRASVAGGTSGGGGVPARQPVALVRGESPRTRVIATLVLLDLVLGYLWLVRRSLPLPAWARGADASTAPDADEQRVSLGIGRFARPRVGPVPRL